MFENIDIMGTFTQRHYQLLGHLPNVVKVKWDSFQGGGGHVQTDLFKLYCPTYLDQILNFRSKTIKIEQETSM